LLDQLSSYLPPTTSHLCKSLSWAFTLTSRHLSFVRPSASYCVFFPHSHRDTQLQARFIHDRLRGGGWAWPRGFLRGGVTTQKGGDVWFFQGKSTRREFEQVHQELAELKRRFLQMEQEWDATSTRVSKVLRRLARAEQAADDRTDAA